MTYLKKPISVLASLSFLLSVTSCQSDLKVSIWKPLPQEIVNKYGEKDSTFFGTYKYIRLLVDSAYNGESPSAEYSKLTYSGFFEYGKKLTREEEELKRDPSFVNEWGKNNKKNLSQFAQDSIKYATYIKDNHYSNFLDFEVIRIFKEKVWVTTYNRVEILFKPKNGLGIRKVAGDVRFIPKDATDDAIRYENYPRAYLSYTGYAKKPFKDNALEINGLTGNSLNSIVGIPIEIVKQKYTLDLNLSELIIDEKYVDIALDSVPYGMRMVLAGDTLNQKVYYIQENFDKEYLPFDQFARHEVQTKLRKEFKTELDFYDKGIDKLYKGALSSILE